MKFLQTLPSTGVNQSEDSEVSDRDLPELAPIDIKDYQRKGKKNCQVFSEPIFSYFLTPK